MLSEHCEKADLDVVLPAVPVAVPVAVLVAVQIPVHPAANKTNVIFPLTGPDFPFVYEVKIERICKNIHLPGPFR